jgi:hypothetical protein
MSPDAFAALLRQHPFPVRERCGDAHEASPAPRAPTPERTTLPGAGEAVPSRKPQAVLARRRRNHMTGFTSW